MPSPLSAFPGRCHSVRGMALTQIRPGFLPTPHSSHLLATPPNQGRICSILPHQHHWLLGLVITCLGLSSTPCHSSQEPEVPVSTKSGHISSLLRPPRAMSPWKVTMVPISFRGKAQILHPTPHNLHCPLPACPSSSSSVPCLLC